MLRCLPSCPELLRFAGPANVWFSQYPSRGLPLDRHEPLVVSRRSLIALGSSAAVATVGSSFAGYGRAAEPASDIVAMDAIALAAAIHNKKVSCVEVMTAFLDQIEKLNPKVNAIVALQDRGALLAEAQGRDDLIERGKYLGPLHGFPQAIKDLEPVKGIRTTFGSPIFRDWVPTTDSIVVERMRRAGAILIGKTNTPELGLGSQTYNPVYGATPNAYDQSRTSGGSSGGAAVSLALRMMAVADGSDYGGSLRNPAGWNNVFGFRTSFGRVPSGGRDVWLPSMGVAGPMARNVADLGMLLSVEAGYDPRVPLSIDEDPTIFAQNLDRDVKGLRIAWLGDFNAYLPFEPGVLDVCREAVKVFEGLGCIVDEAVPDYPVNEVWRAFMQLRAWQIASGLIDLYRDPVKRALLKPEAIYEIESGMKLSALDVSAASAVRTGWYQAVRSFFQKYDYFILPTAQVFPFDVNLHWPTQIAGRKMETYHEWMQVVTPVTMSGCPALAAPAGFGQNGLPMGIQIVGPNHRELACLQLAYAYDQATKWPKRRPPALLGSA